MELVSELTENQNKSVETARKRLRGFAMHLLAYFAMMLVLVPLNLFLNPETLWFVFPLVGWGSMLAIHVTFVMGLWDSGKAS